MVQKTGASMLTDLIYCFLKQMNNHCTGLGNIITLLLERAKKKHFSDFLFFVHTTGIRNNDLV